LSANVGAKYRPPNDQDRHHGVIETFMVALYLRDTSHAASSPLSNSFTNTRGAVFAIHTTHHQSVTMHNISKLQRREFGFVELVYEYTRSGIRHPYDATIKASPCTTY
jgi:hypothetical protein